MNLLRYLKNFNLPRWSSIIPILFYLLFILLILSVTFPINKTNNLIKPKGNIKNLTLLNSINKNYDYNYINKQHKETVIIKNTNIEVINLLKSIFKKADLNSDSLLDIEEIGRFINTRIREHIDNAIKTNPYNFALIDKKPQDGLITWEEYHAYFLKQHGLDETYISQHDEKKHLKLDRKAKESMMRDKALWGEAARTDPFSLTLDEFLSFRHPESSAANLLTLVDELLAQLDLNGDDLLSMDEYINLSLLDLTNERLKYSISLTHDERREEFKRLIDQNNDGKADRGELIKYLDPRYPRHSLQEAISLINLADTDDDKQLSLNEVLIKSNAFMTSKMINKWENFHNEY